MLLTERMICQNCGTTATYHHGTRTRRWMRSAAAFMVAVPCALAAAVIWTRSPGYAWLALISAGAAVLTGLAIALFKPQCPACGNRALVLEATRRESAPRPQQHRSR